MSRSRMASARVLPDNPADFITRLKDQLASVATKDCELMAQQRVANRAGRIEPRVVKRRPKPYPLLAEQRHQARESVQRYGHPKKL